MRAAEFSSYGKFSQIWFSALSKSSLDFASSISCLISGIRNEISEAPFESVYVRLPSLFLRHYSAEVTTSRFDEHVRPSEGLSHEATLVATFASSDLWTGICTCEVWGVGMLLLDI